MTQPTKQYAIGFRKKVEMLFAHLKRILGLGRLRLRGPCGANEEFLLAATAQNLRKHLQCNPDSEVLFKNIYAAALSVFGALSCTVPSQLRPIITAAVPRQSESPPN